MKIKKLYTHYYIFLLMVFVLVFTSCGPAATNSNGNNNNSSSVSGVVADGHLQGATVFLDCNTNFMLSTGEPSAKSGEGGKYSITGASETQIANCPVVVDATSVTNVIDEDDTTSAGVKRTLEQAGRPGFKMSAPAGKHDFISPFSMVSHSIDISDPNKRMEILERLGITEADLNALGLTSETFFTEDFLKYRNSNNPTISNIAFKISEKARMFSYFISSAQQRKQVGGFECMGEDCLNNMLDIVSHFTNMEKQLLDTSSGMMEKNHKGMPTFKAGRGTNDLFNKFDTDFMTKFNTDTDFKKSLTQRHSFPSQSFNDRLKEQLLGGLWIRSNDGQALNDYCHQSNGKHETRFIFFTYFLFDEKEDIALTAMLPSAYQIAKNYSESGHNPSHLSAGQTCTTELFNKKILAFQKGGEDSHAFKKAAAEANLTNIYVTNQVVYSVEFSSSPDTSNQLGELFHLKGKKVEKNKEINAYFNKNYLTFTIEGQNAVDAKINGTYYFKKLITSSDSGSGSHH